MNLELPQPEQSDSSNTEGKIEQMKADLKEWPDFQLAISYRVFKDVRDHWNGTLDTTDMEAFEVEMIKRAEVRLFTKLLPEMAKFSEEERRQKGEQFLKILDAAINLSAEELQKRGFSVD